MLKKLLVLLTPLIFSSCIVLSTKNIYVLEPASTPLGPQFRSMGLINRLIIEQPDNEELQDPEGMEESMIESYNLATTSILFDLADILNESPGVDYIGEENMVEMSLTNLDSGMRRLEPDFVRYLSDSLNVNGFISLEGYYINFQDTIIQRPGESHTGWASYFSGEVNLEITALWRIYSAEDGNLLNEYLLEDTLTWEEAAYTIDELLDLLPEPDEVLPEAAYFTALMFARRIAPYWTEQERFFYSTGNRLLRRAARYLAINETEKAGLIYEELIERRDYGVVSAAMLNLALINELSGRFREALVWARKSYETRKSPVTAWYIDVLEERLRSSVIIDSQIGIER